jgi:hypothetical protein
MIDQEVLREMRNNAVTALAITITIITVVFVIVKSVIR